MIDYILEIHRRLYTQKVLLPNQGYGTLKGKFLICGVRILSTIFNFLLYLGLYECSPSGKTKSGLVVSFTSYPARIYGVHYVVESILRQNTLPELIVLWLSSENFPNKEADLPKKLLNLKSNRFHIEWVDEDLKPHKKYFYTIQKFPDYDFITIDDDLFYRKDMIERLVKMHQSNPGMICSNNIHDIKIENAKVAHYSKWGRQIINQDSSSYLFLPVGFGGVYYPAHIFDNSDVLNKCNIKETCLCADDLWLKVHSLLNNVCVATGAYYSSPIGIKDSEKSALTLSNVTQSGQSGNDIQWRKISIKYPVEKRILEHYN